MSVDAVSPRGGKRFGAGRKPLDDSGPSVVVTVRLTALQKLTFDFIGGAPWLREQLESLLSAGESRSTRIAGRHREFLDAQLDLLSGSGGQA